MDVVTLCQYKHTNSKGITYYLNQKGKLFFFSKDAGRAEMTSLPEGHTVIESAKTGLPVVKKAL